jgi:hypothetical protein
MEKYDIQVIATPPPGNDLVAVFFGDNEVKGQRLKEILEAKKELNLYQRILASGQYGQEKQLIDPAFKIDNVFPPQLIKESDSIVVAFNRYSLDGINHDSANVVSFRFIDNASIRFGSDWGAEIKIGNDELGYPFWTSGNMSFLALYKRIKLGLQTPFAGGKEGVSTFDVLWKPRQLNGAYGIAGEFDAAFAGGSFIFGFPRTDTDGTFVDSKNIYYIRNMAQLWYSYVVSIANKADLLRFKIGAGFHQLAHEELVKGQTETVGGVRREIPDEIKKVENLQFFWSPYVKVEFMNQQFKHRFGASLQYYKEWVLGTAWLEILRNRLRIELKGAAPLFREHEAWEPPYFVTLTVPYTFSF